MEERISKEKGDRDIASIKELNLDNCKSSNVVGISEDWKSLEELNLIHVGLTTLKGFPRLPNLKKLELSDNNLCEGLDALACLPKLEELNLSGNKIKDLEAFEPLGQVSTLKKLNLFGCDICKLENYRERMFDIIPSLVYLDGLDKNKEAQEKNGVDGKDGKEEGEESPEDDESIDEEEDEDEEEENDEEDIPLEALYGKINDEVDDEDFEVDEEEEDEDIDEDDEEDASVNVSRDNSEETEVVRGTKRKHEEDQ